MQINVFTDGGSRGNPGKSGFGLVIFDQNQTPVYQESCYLGIKTNNEAEYLGLIAALTWIRDHASQLNIQNINLFSDSQLIVRQVQGIYKVKSPNIRPLYLQATTLLNQINLPYQFKDVPRSQNQLADKLANLAMDRAC